MPTLSRSAPARVVHVSAKAHDWGLVHLNSDLQVKTTADYDSRAGSFLGNLKGTYADSKLLQIMYSQRLGRKLLGSGVVASVFLLI